MDCTAIVIGGTLPAKSVEAVHFGTKAYLNALSMYMKVRYFGIGKICKDKKYRLNENCEIENLSLSPAEKILRDGVIGLLYLFRIRSPYLLRMEITYFFAKKARRKIKMNAEQTKNPVIVFDRAVGNLSLMKDFHSFPKIYRPHNVEKVKFEADIQNLNFVEKALNQYFFLLSEKKLIKDCDLVFAYTPEDAEIFCETCGAEKSKVLFIPLPVDCDKIHVPPAEVKEKIKRELGFGDKILCLFMGLSGKPKVPLKEQPKAITDGVIPFLAECKKLKEDVAVVFIGKGCEYLKEMGNLPPNVYLKGFVEENVKEKFLIAADIGVNPMPSGSGINTRMVEYMLYGVPTVTTPVGARGFPGIEDGKNSIIREIPEFASAINMLAEDKNLREKIGLGGRKIIEENFDARVVGRKMYSAILSLLAQHHPKNARGGG